MNKTKLEKFKSVYKEVAKAYADCHEEDMEKAYLTRSLNFLSDHLVGIDTAVSVFSKYVNGYNNFTPDLLNYLKEIDPNGSVCIARESSVCIYFAVEKKVWDDDEEDCEDDFTMDFSLVFSKLCADEISCFEMKDYNANIAFNPNYGIALFSKKHKSFLDSGDYLVFRIWWD